MNVKNIHQGLAELQAMIDDGPPLVANDQRRSEFSRFVNKHPMLVCLGAVIAGAIITLVALFVIGAISVKRGAPINPVAAHIVGPPVAMGTKSLANITTHPAQDRSPARASLQKEIKPVSLDVGPREGRALSIPVVMSLPISTPKAQDDTQLFADFLQAYPDKIDRPLSSAKKGGLFLAPAEYVPRQSETPAVKFLQVEPHRRRNYYHWHHSYAGEPKLRADSRNWCGYQVCPSNEPPASER